MKAPTAASETATQCVDPVLSSSTVHRMPAPQVPASNRQELPASSPASLPPPELLDALVEVLLVALLDALVDAPLDAVLVALLDPPLDTVLAALWPPEPVAAPPSTTK